MSPPQILHAATAVIIPAKPGGEGLANALCFESFWEGCSEAYPGRRSGIYFSMFFTGASRYLHVIAWLCLRGSALWLKDAPQ